MKRRTHQTVEVPAQPNQEVFQTLVDLAIEERSGGYGDRSGKKNERCDKVKVSTTLCKGECIDVVM